MLTKTAVVEIALQRKRVGQPMHASERDGDEVVLKHLWRRVHGLATQIEQFDWSRGGRAEAVGGGADVEVQFRILVLAAEIGIEAAQLRRRLVAPAFLVQRLAGNVAGEIAGF